MSRAKHPGVKAFVRKVSIRISRGQGSWLTLLLLLVVLVPSVCLLWLMNQTVRNERLAGRQRLVEAYRGHLSLTRARLETFWKQQAADLESQAVTLPAASLFAREIRDGLADAVVCFGPTGNVVYPSHASWSEPESSEITGSSWTAAEQLESSDLAAAAGAYAAVAHRTTNASLAALALQAQARCLVQAGSNAEAIAVLTGPLSDPRYRKAADPQGRLIIPNAELLALELLKVSSPDRIKAPLQRLRTQLLDYDRSSMPSAQRRFLMRELQRLFPDEARFPTLAAEELAARYVEAGTAGRLEAGFHPTPLPGIWQFSSAGGRVVTLHRIENLPARWLKTVAPQDLPTDVRVDFVAPGQEAKGSIRSEPAGTMFPGWRLALSPANPALFDVAARERATTYVWIVVLAVATVCVLALLALSLVRRQLALTQLRNDLVANVTHELKTPLSSMRLLVETLLDSPRLEEQTAREYLKLIATENVRLSRLIDNFLTFSRIERNKYSFDFKEVPATAIAEGAAAAVRERFNAPGCRFEVSIPSDLPRMVADEGALVTALVNLLDNAYKYSGDDKRITLTAGAENGTVRFTVADNGIGLSSRDAKRIFKRFFQVDRQASRTTGGCGLGLSIVQFVVSAHGGTVRVDSRPGSGSRFIVSIPANGPNPGSTEVKP